MAGASLAWVPWVPWNPSILRLRFSNPSIFEKKQKKFNTLRISTVFVVFFK